MSVRIKDFSFKNIQTKWVVVVMAAGCLITVQPVMQAYAHQNPVGCNSNRFNISIVKDRTEVYQGQTLTYTVTASNANLGGDLACDITNATIDVTLPAADGSPTGSVITLVAGQDFPAGSPPALVGSAQYVVNVNPGVTDIVAQGRASGTLHDAPVDHSALIVKTLGTTVVAPPVTPPSDSGGGGAPNSPRFPNTGLARKSE